MPASEGRASGAHHATSPGLIASRLAPAEPYVACSQLKLPDRNRAPACRARRGAPRGCPRLGIGARLGLGLAAVAAVLVAADILATRTAREALEAVRSMQNEHEPLASRADAVLVRLIDYDRAVGEYVQARQVADFAAITHRRRRARGCARRLLRRRRRRRCRRRRSRCAPSSRGTSAARPLAASRAAQRAQWLDARRGAR